MMITLWNLLALVMFAHRKCIQKWCNKKGDITCEICNQVFTPNYTLPPKPVPDVMAVDLSQAWGHHFGFRDHHLLALAAAERQLLESEYEDYAVANAGNVTYLRSIAIILMFVLLIHQVLMITRDFGLMQGYMTFFHISCGPIIVSCSLIGGTDFIGLGIESMKFPSFSLLAFFFHAMSWSAHGTSCTPGGDDRSELSTLTSFNQCLNSDDFTPTKQEVSTAYDLLMLYIAPSRFCYQLLLLVIILVFSSLNM
uniref:RING-CH-type domain-containing protein n=1 Tax=Chenopodium quinoa TaxID=63459 RepID=A0A803M5S4_CHEQI